MKNSLLPLLFLIGTSIMNSIYSADADKVDNSPPLRRAGPPARKPVIQRASEPTYPIAEQIVKEKIRIGTAAAMRKRLHDAIVAWHGSPAIDDDGHVYEKPTNLLFTKIFYADSEDQLSRTVFDLVAKNESQPGFVAEASTIHVPGVGRIDTLATPKRLDGFTMYRWITDEHGKRALECNAGITSPTFLERIITDVEKNG